MTNVQSSRADYVVLSPRDYRVLGPQDFGSPGLEAIEILGPFVGIVASGPLITVHDSTIDPHLGIHHHPHRRNERLFYMESGELDHSDTRNNIEGHLNPGDTGLFTEGQRGMIHSEWNNGNVPSRIFILVYITDPVPEDTSFTVLSDADSPRYEEAAGVMTKEVVGTRSPLRVHGDVRFFADSSLDRAAAVELVLDPGEGGLVSVREGIVRLDGRELGVASNIIFPPMDRARKFRLEAMEASRVLRASYGPGLGFQRQ